MDVGCHGCTEGSSVLGWAWHERQARMSPAGRDASVAPAQMVARSFSMVTDRSWFFAGMTKEKLLPESIICSRQVAITD